jgi:hypothetical protein
MSATPSSPSAPTRINPPPPQWARIVDVLCVLLVVLAVIVAEWGGFRMRIGGVRIALTSAYRLIGAAVLLAAVRHLFARGTPIYRDLPLRIRHAWSAPAVRVARLAFVGTRPAILFIGYFAVITFGHSNGRPPMRYSVNELLNLQGRWDATWYLNVAVDGYRYAPGDPTAQQNIVFFPALPVATRIVGRLFGGASTAFLMGGTLIVFAAFFWALIYAYRLARELLPDDDSARWAIWLIAGYPFALFYSALYTESLFLLGALGAFYHFRRQEFLKAAVWGLLVGLTRPNGCFLSVPLALMAVGPWLPRALVGGPPAALERDPSRRHMPTLVAALASASAPGIGVLLYSAFIWQLTGDPLAWAEGHAAWGRQYSGLLPLATKYYGYMAESGPYVFTVALPFDTLNALGAVFVLVTAIPVWRRFGLPYAVFILVNILPPLAAGGFLSTGRLSAVLFPAFFWFATVVPVRHRQAWLGSFMAIQGLNAALFYTWRELF